MGRRKVSLGSQVKFENQQIRNEQRTNNCEKKGRNGDEWKNYKNFSTRIIIALVFHPYFSKGLLHLNFILTLKFLKAHAHPTNQKEGTMNFVVDMRNKVFDDVIQPMVS